MEYASIRFYPYKCIVFTGAHSRSNVVLTTSMHLIHLCYQNILTSQFNNSYYGVGVIYFGICIYVLLLYAIFSVVFLHDLRKVKSLNDLGILSDLRFISVSIILIFLSMSGIPPLMGFVSKFLAINFIFFSAKGAYVTVFVISNIFSIYFYVQNLRFIAGKEHYSQILIVNHLAYINKDLVNTLVLLNFINVFGIIYFEDIAYTFIGISLFKSLN